MFIWKEVGQGAGKSSGGEVQDGWERIKEHTLHTASVNSIAWAPYDLGPILACASSDGKISVLTFQSTSRWILTGKQLTGRRRLDGRCHLQRTRLRRQRGLVGAFCPRDPEWRDQAWAAAAAGDCRQALRVGRLGQCHPYLGL